MRVSTLFVSVVENMGTKRINVEIFLSSEFPRSGNGDDGGATMDGKERDDNNNLLEMVPWKLVQRRVPKRGKSFKV